MIGKRVRSIEQTWTDAWTRPTPDQLDYAKSCQEAHECDEGWMTADTDLPIGTMGTIEDIDQDGTRYMIRWDDFSNTFGEYHRGYTFMDPEAFQRNVEVIQ
jgi:hypothetical protein